MRAEANWLDIHEEQRAKLKREDCDDAIIEDFKSCQENDRLKFKVFVAADADDKPLGFVSIGEIQNPTVKLPYGAILDLYVDDKQRNKGVGNELLAHALKFINEQGYSHAGLYVSIKNEAAAQMYKKSGFYIDKILLMKKLL
jgi:ribosomal protein S18 acetylase RimI-like enzyme